MAECSGESSELLWGLGQTDTELQEDMAQAVKR